MFAAATAAAAAAAIETDRGEEAEDPLDDLLGLRLGLRLLPAASA